MYHLHEQNVTEPMLHVIMGLSSSEFVLLGNKIVYSGRSLQHEVTGLQSNMQYTFKVRACTEGDESAFSDTVSVTTEEAGM